MLLLYDRLLIVLFAFLLVVWFNNTIIHPPSHQPPSQSVPIISPSFFTGIRMASSSSSSSSSSSTPSKKVVIAATRLHLGQASVAPTADQLHAKMKRFAQFCASSTHILQGVIAVDATPPEFDVKYNLVTAVQQACDKALQDISKAASTTATTTTNNNNNNTLPTLIVLPVTPWGRFVPALNALIGYAAGCCQAHAILFVSIETATLSAGRDAVPQLLHHLYHQDNNNNDNDNDNDDTSTLVVGARLAGHDFQGKSSSSSSPDATTTTTVALTGRTTPWNTLAVWNLRKLCLVGYSVVSEGYLTSSTNDPSYGVEEAVAIAMVQKLLGPTAAVAKLVVVEGVVWDDTFDGDGQRQEWHARKMESKSSRAARQLELLGNLTGQVQHIG